MQNVTRCIEIKFLRNLKCKGESARIEFFHRYYSLLPAVLSGGHGRVQCNMTSFLKYIVYTDNMYLLSACQGPSPNGSRFEKRQEESGWKMKSDSSKTKRLSLTSPQFSYLRWWAEHPGHRSNYLRNLVFTNTVSELDIKTLAPSTVLSKIWECRYFQRKHYVEAVLRQSSPCAAIWEQHMESDNLSQPSLTFISPVPFFFGMGKCRMKDFAGIRAGYR